MLVACRGLIPVVAALVTALPMHADERSPVAAPPSPAYGQNVAAPEANGPNQVVNGGFATDYSFWNPILSLPSFATLDAGGSPSSGSVLVRNARADANAPVDLRQCLTITGLTPGKQYAWGGKVRIPSGQLRSGYAYMYLVWVSNLTSYDYCSGHVRVDAGAVVHSSSVPANQWIPLTGPVVVAPAGAIGAQISFNNQKDQAFESFAYYADDAFLYETNVVTTTTITGPASGSSGVPLGFEASATGCAPLANGWNWTSTPAAAITGASTRTASITFPAGGTYTVGTSNTACGSSASKQVSITARGAQLAVTSPPGGMVQDPGVGGATDSYALTNVGGASTNVTLSGFGSFFTQAPESFTLAAGATQIVRLTGLAQPAGLYGGASQISASGLVPLEASVTLLVAAPPAGSVSAVPERNRVDVVDTSSGTAAFANGGTGTLTGTVVSKSPWLRAGGSAIVIPPGSSRSVPFTIDRSARPDASAPLGSVSGGLELVFRASSSSSRSSAEETPATGASLVSIVDTVRPPTSGTTIPALPAGQLALFVAGVKRGAGNSGQLSDLSLTSSLPSGAIGDLVLYYTPSGGGSSQQATPAALAPGGSLALADVVKSAFGSEGQTGTIQLRSSLLSRISVAAAAINTASASGSFGTLLPVFRSDRGIAPVADAPGTLVLTGLRSDAVTRTDLYLQETIGLPTKVQIQFRDASGLVLETRVEDLAPFALVVREGSVPAGAVMATLSHFTESTGRFVAFATPVDLRSGDSWAIADWRHHYAYSGTQATVIPVAGSLRGINGTNFRTEVALTNVGSSSGSLTARFYPRGRAAVERSVPLDSMKSRIVADVVADLFNVAGDAVGHIVLTPSSGNFVVSSRTYTVSAGGSTLGTGVPALPLAGTLRAGDSRLIGGLDDSAAATVFAPRAGTFRTNFGLAETSGKSARVRVSLRYTWTASGLSLAASTATASKEYQLAANQFLLLGSIARELIGNDRDLRFGDLRNMQAEFAVTGGDGAVAVFVSSTDNGSGDTLLRVD